LAPFEHEGGEHLLHAVDFGGLVGVYVGGDSEDGFFLAGALRAEQLIDHGNGSLVVLDHEPQEQPVEVWALARSSCASCSAANIRASYRVIHARHHVVRRVHHRNRLIVPSQRSSSTIRQYPTTIRSHMARTAWLASCVGAQPANGTACAW
jgi:hypothetical protein